VELLTLFLQTAEIYLWNVPDCYNSKQGSLFMDAQFQPNVPDFNPLDRWLREYEVAQFIR